MLPSGFRMWFGLGLIATLAMTLQGWTTSSEHSPAGPLTIGLLGSVGDHVGYAVLLGLAFTSFALAAISVAFRGDEDRPPIGTPDIDPNPALPPVAGQAEHATSIADRAPNAVPANSIWPIVAALGVLVVTLGLVFGGFIVAIGVLILVVTGVGWIEEGRRAGLPELADSAPPADELAQQLISIPRIDAVANALTMLVLLIGGYLLFRGMFNDTELILPGVMVLGIVVVVRSLLEWMLDGGQQPGPRPDQRM